MADAPVHRVADRPAATSPLVLVALVLLCLGVSAIGGAITASGVDSWYPALQLPAVTPRAWVYAPVWTTLCLLMAVATWRVWGQRRRTPVRAPLILFTAQLGLSLVWTVLFSGVHHLGAAFVAIVLLLVIVAVTTIVYLRIDRLAGWLFVPYLGWTAFATWLMWQVWQLNSA